jgi:GTPase SAR1 family protein
MKNMIDCENALKAIVELFKDSDKIRNEAQTRHHIINKIIYDVLDWPEDQVEVEDYEQKTFTDYQLGKPRQVIIEAKREGRTFEIPAGLSKKNIIDISSLLKSNADLKGAIEQVQLYCSTRGTPIAIATNGHQYISFIASNQNGCSPLEGKALVFDSLENMLENFTLVWNMLSYYGVKEQRLIKYLSSDASGIPNKLSSYLTMYPKVRYASDIQTSLRQISELIIQDALESKDVEESFYQRCYCESGALSRYALLSKEMLQARYAALFSDSEVSPQITSVKPDRNQQSLDPSIMAEALSKRPIVLIGDVGVGKTSFVKNLIYSSAFKEFNEAIYIYIDLGSSATLSDNLQKFILNEIEEQLLNKYKTDIAELKFIRGVYSRDIQRFSSGIWGGLKETNREKYDDKQLEMLADKINSKDEHLKNSINHISKQTKRQVIICLDNADQRDFETQQRAFVISQELAKEWNSLVFISVRPQTFFKSKSSGALTAYPHKVFTIAPPRIDHVLDKRLQFALEMSEGKIPLERAEFVRINIKNLSIFIKVLLDSLRNNKALGEFIENITGGNVRQALSFITGFIGSPNVEAEKIIKTYEEKGRYQVPVHEFSKQALLGEFSHFDPNTSLAMNLFDVSIADESEHFLVPMIVALLSEKNDIQDRDGFCGTPKIIEEMQLLGYIPEQTENALRRATNKKLIETSQRFTFDEDETGLIGDMPNKFRTTSIGQYHLKRWISDFAYLDAMLFDTPIFNPEVVNDMRASCESFAIEERYRRAMAFKTYLTSVWNKLIHKPSYFDLLESLKMGDSSFESVKRAIDNNPFHR